MIRLMKTYGPIVLLLGLSTAVIASPLDDQLKAFKENTATANESTIKALLQLGDKETRAAEVVAAIKPWLQSNPVSDPNTLYLAATSFELAGDFVTASSFYRNLLATNPLPKPLVDQATPRFYRMMIIALNDSQSAYMYMRKHGGALRGYGNAKQFDRWFLKQAFVRKDFIGAADRLADIHNSGDAKDHQEAMKTFLEQIETFTYKSPELFDALKKMSRAKVPNTVKLRLNWVVEILPVNTKVNELFQARKEVPASIYGDAARAAEALVTALPYEGSILVLRGWCNYGDGHSPNYIQKTGYHRNLTTPPILKVIAKLPPAKVRLLLETRVLRNRGVVSIFDPKDMAKLVISKPEVFNSIVAPHVPLYYKGMTAAAAKTLAPNLARNPSMDAALIRAVAAGQAATVIQASEYIAKNEMWRFTDETIKNKHLSRFVWNSGLKREQRENKIERILSKAFTTGSAAYTLGKKSPSDHVKRVQTKLVENLLSEKPSIAGALGLFDKAANAGSVDDKINFIKSIATAKMSGEREFLLRRASDTAYMGKKNRYARIIAFPHHDHNQNFLRFGRKEVQKAGEVLGPYFQGLLKKQITTGSLSETLVGMWMRCVDPKDKNAIAFMNKLVASPAWKTVNPDYLKLAQDGYYFGNALAVGQTDSPATLSKELTALPAKPNAQQVKAALTAVIARLKTAPYMPGMYGLDKVAGQPAAMAPFAEDIFNRYAPLDISWNDYRYRTIASNYASYLLKKKDFKATQAVAQKLWFFAHLHGDRTTGSYMVKIAEQALEAGDISSLATISRIGLRHNPSNSRHGHEKENRTILKRLYAKASEAMGIAEIPIQENEPGYKIYLSQREYVQENLDTAWSLYDKHSAEIEPVLEKLRQDYCFWLLQRNVEAGNVQRVEDLVKFLTIWDRRGNANFDLQQQAELKLAYADVAFKKRAYGTARSWYRKVSDSREYKGSEQQYRALLGSVAVDRQEKNYGPALAELEKLMLINDPELRNKVRFSKAQILFDQENFVGALEEVDSVLRTNPKHSEAVILQGEIWVRMRRLERAADIEIGDPTIKEVIVPGEYIKIDLTDPTLRLSGTGASIEAEVFSSSGDSERVMLRPLGDGKSKYRAEIMTRLGAPKKGDKILQVLGRDTITYGYSKRFRAKMKDLPKDPDEKIAIASDFRLDASAGAFPARDGERRLTIEELGLSTADQALGFSKVRPGNPIYVRVVDPDQSLTSKVDTIEVEVKSTSGDLIKSFMLEETGPYTGEFEGQVPTTAGQAVAFAYSSDPGTDPNMAISSNQAYPGWVGQAASKADKYFTVDLNDNVGLKTMTIASPKGKALTQFVLQTSMNGTDWRNCGAWPETPGVVWDGRPQFTVVDNGGALDTAKMPLPKTFELPKELSRAMYRGLTTAKIRSATGTVKNLKGLKIPDLGSNYAGGFLRFRALFYQSEVALRKFRVSGFPKMAGHTVFLIDGKPSSGEDPFTIQREFQPGLHEIEVWNRDHSRHYSRGKMELLCDANGDELSTCPDSMFDPTTFPEKIQKTMIQPTTITSTAGGTYEVAFGKNTRGQLVRVLIAGHEGDSPAISRVTLTDEKGKQQLPVTSDFQKLRQNQRLEVLPGDSVFVTYIDNHPYTTKRNKASKRLTVAFNTAEISASFINYVTGRNGRELQLEDIRRFKLDDNVGFIIKDADMDATSERDKIKFKVRSSDGNVKEFTAYETLPHSGVFLGKVFPVAKEPQRDSEIKVPEGGTLTAIYRDMENLEPGIPTDRMVTVEHAKYRKPQFGVYTAVTDVVPFKPKAAPKQGKTVSKRRSANSRASEEELISSRFALGSRYVSSDQMSSAKLEAIYGSSIRFEVVAPHLAFAESSTITAYVQTESGRQSAQMLRKRAEAEGKPMPKAIQPFDVTVPGTLKLSATCNGGRGLALPPGYVSGQSTGSGSNQSPLGEGRFSFSVPLSLGDVPIRSFATKSAESLPSSEIPNELAVRNNDKIHVGYAYLDKNGKPNWYTTTYSLRGDVIFDVMEEDFETHCQPKFVGQKVFVRVVAPHMDVSPNRDAVTVTIESKTGFKVPFEIRETLEHTGVFKGSFKLDYAKSDGGGNVDPNTFFMHGFPVLYGDTVTVTHPDGHPKSFSFGINNGANGVVEPFSKRYADSSMAVKTNFTLAECLFELAKKHRKMGKDDDTQKGKDLEGLSRREMGQAKKLLLESLATHREPELQAQAEYLLGNLSYEYADTSKNKVEKEDGYKDALARFQKIPQDYPDSAFASKAQYKKAMVFDKMGALDDAVEEFAKLAYKYPNDELIPKAISQIGDQVETLALKYYKEAQEQLKSNDLAVKEAGEKRFEDANREFARAAKIFATLRERFPENELAGLAGVRAGENLVRVKDYRGALDILQPVHENEEYDGNKVIAAALFWCAWSNDQLDADGQSNKGDSKREAFKLYNRVRYEYSTTAWAKKARGRLASKSFEKIIAEDKKRREALLEALKKR